MTSTACLLFEYHAPGLEQHACSRSHAKLFSKPCLSAPAGRMIRRSWEKEGIALKDHLTITCHPASHSLGPNAHFVCRRCMPNISVLQVAVDTVHNSGTKNTTCSNPRRVLDPTSPISYNAFFVRSAFISALSLISGITNYNYIF